MRLDVFVKGVQNAVSVRFGLVLNNPIGNMPFRIGKQIEGPLVRSVVYPIGGQTRDSRVLR